MALKYIDSPTEFVADSVDLNGNAQGQISASSVAAQSAVLTKGIYDVWCSATCYIKVATTANDVTTSTGYIIQADNVVTINVRDEQKIGVITGGASATFCYHKVS